MNEETLKKAKDIEAEMQRLRDENDMLMEYVFQPRPDRKWEKIRPVQLFTKMKNKLTLQKSAYGGYKEEILFDLTKDDIDLLFDCRLKKYHELKAELESL